MGIIVIMITLVLCNFLGINLMTQVFGNSKIKLVNVHQLQDILQSSTRNSYQIIDVREPSETQSLSLPDSNVIYLPLSEKSQWGPKVIKGELLDKQKPTLCLCRSGKRSYTAADFLGKLNLFVFNPFKYELHLINSFLLVDKAKFEDVSSIDGGILAYRSQINRGGL